jgi:hypothetical protein
MRASNNNEVEKKAIFNFTDMQSQIVDFYRNQFKVRFFKEDTLDFITSLHADCKDNLLPKQAPRPQAQEKDGKNKVLYFTSNPNQLNPLDFEEEFSVIKKAFLLKEAQGSFETPEWIPAVTQAEMLKKINEVKPNVVVISMHGSQEKGLMFKEGNNTAAPFAIDNFVRAIRELTQSRFNRLDCIVFSCCHSQEFAEKAIQYIPYAIGIEGPIQDEAMPVFTDGFFDSYFSDKEIEQAYRMGKLLVEEKKTLSQNAQRIRFFHKQ